LEEKPDTFMCYTNFLLGFAFFTTIFKTCQVIIRTSNIGKTFCEKYKISTNGIYDLSNKFTSSSFAILSCIVGWRTFSQCHGDIMLDRFIYIDHYMVFAASYFIYDIMSMFIVHNTLKKDTISVRLSDIQRFITDNPLIIFHHFLIPFIIVILNKYRNDIGDCIIASILLLEASTPFVSFRVVLTRLNLKDSSIYVINGILMMATFFTFRVIFIPMIYFWFASNKSVGMLVALQMIPLKCHLTTLCVWIPQLYWFYKMVNGLQKLLQEQKMSKLKSS